MAWVTSLSVFLLALALHTKAFDINDPKTNIESLVRVIGSTNPNDTDILYGNGTIYGRQPFQQLKKLFYFEGFNIGRKVSTGDGFLSLTREVFVYRHLLTGQIINIWTNEFTEKSNEIYQVHNDPVDMEFTFGAEIIPTVRFQESGVGFTSDILLQYPNPLDPVNYTQFSAGPLYQADELFQYFSDYNVLATTNISSVNMTGAWFRRGQYLPWMQMAETPGHLFYQTSNWKCVKGFKDFSPDLLQLVKSRFPTFLTPPSKFDPVPQTTWGVIKNTIDYRRAHGLPDVIFPLINISKNATPKTNTLDPRIQSDFATDNIQVFFNGSVYTEITGQQSVELFKVTGTFTALAKHFGPQDIIFIVKALGDYRDPETQQVISVFKNPVTGKTTEVPKFQLDTDVQFQMDDIFSFKVPHLDKITVQARTSSTRNCSMTGKEKWSVDMLTVFFRTIDLDNSFPYFYGTWARFLSWDDWLEMGDIDGNLIWRVSIERIIEQPSALVGKH